eukprot:scaffold585_cov97-Cylindrotheca_fusiformis.AAC.3
MHPSFAKSSILTRKKQSSFSNMCVITGRSSGGNNKNNGEKATEEAKLVNNAVQMVSTKAKEWAELPIARKIKLLEQILANGRKYRDEWVTRQEKKMGIDVSSNPMHGYARFDMLSRGPAIFGGYANGILNSLKHSRKYSIPPKPTSIRQLGDKTIATVWPGPYAMLDSLEAFGMTGELVCRTPSNGESLQKTQEESILDHYQENTCVAILAAGNFDAPSDLLNELFINGRVCVYKPNPINEASVPVLKKILEPVVSLGYVEFIPQSIYAAQTLVKHEQVQGIVLIGSKATHDKIKWGSTPEEQEQNQLNDTPINRTPITAELGAVTPWIVVPGPQWNHKSVDKHARTLAFAKMTNNGHMCISPQVVVLPRNWKHRAYFWERTRYWLSKHPGSVPYYPGSAETHQEFQKHPNAQVVDDKVVFPNQQRPIIISDLSLAKDKDLFHKEAWCPVLMELPIDCEEAEAQPMTYLKQAIETTQSKLHGSLSIALLINDKTIQRNKEEFDDIVVNRMRYGIVGINIWPAYSFSISQLRWGAFPGNPASGSGLLGNANLYRNTEKTILRAPFYHLPRKGLEVTSAKQVALMMSRLTTYKLKPSIWTQLGLLLALFLGM